ncbi:hypothetical protein NE237_032196 [Protea cynaroides]|uniref:Uncharacterized protein n=1 Tax=Protea cynaroides TaxID=273540 RepID=A0A9Q0R362_9MAGN|nr:hypothetical protein NE237_032196 [Protea cynaroides]
MGNWSNGHWPRRKKWREEREGGRNITTQFLQSRIPSFVRLNSKFGCYAVEYHKNNMTDKPEDSEHSMPSAQEQEEALKRKYGGLVPKKPPLISKDHERAFFDSADWALGKQGASGEKPKESPEALRPKLEPTQQQSRSRKSPYAPADGEDGGNASEDAASE